MSIEQLIKQLLEAITSITWTPGTYPQSLATMKTKPVGAWGVTTGSGSTTSTRRVATVETNVSTAIWCATPEARASAKAAVMAALTMIGFVALVPSDAEVVIEDQSTAYVSSMTFRAWIDSVTGWVYQSQNS